MPSHKLISGFYHWVYHPNLQKKINPECDIKRRLHSAPTNLGRYYLVAAIAQSHISSPGWGLYSELQLRDIKDTIDTTTTVQMNALSMLDFNRTKIDAAPSTVLFRSFLSRKDEKYNCHSSHLLMNLNPQTQIPECKTIGLARMLVCALHPMMTLAGAPCFASEDGRRQMDLAVYVSARAKEIEMTSSLPS